MSANWQYLRLAAARYALRKDRPYLATALWALRIDNAPNDAVPTVAVRRNWALSWNEEFVASCTDGELAGVLYHEVCHLLRQHFERGDELKPELPTLWLIATDLEINDDLMEERVKLPREAARPVQFGLTPRGTAEEYYEQLREQADQHWFQRAQGRAFVCAAAWTGEPEAEGGTSSTEISLLGRAAAREIVEYAKSRGTVPGHLERAAVEILEPTVPWQEELRRVLGGTLGLASGMVDYSYSRPSRRRLPGIVLPRLVRPEPEVGVVIDTSGSMTPKELSQALAEVGGIVRARGAAIRVYPTDAAVHEVRRVCSAREVRLLGGGGTDMRRGIAAAEADRNDVIVVITDGGTPWPSQPPRKPVVVVLTESYWARRIPRWARVIVTDDSARYREPEPVIVLDGSVRVSFADE